MARVALHEIEIEIAAATVAETVAETAVATTGAAIEAATGAGAVDLVGGLPSQLDFRNLSKRSRSGWLILSNRNERAPGDPENLRAQNRSQAQNVVRLGQWSQRLLASMWAILITV